MHEPTRQPAAGRWRAHERAAAPHLRRHPAAISARPRPRTHGQALVEFALILPLFLLLALTAIDLGRVFYSQITVTNAARAGAVEAAYQPTSYSAGAACSATNLIVCAATNEAAGSMLTVAPADIAVICSPSCATGATPANQVTVTVTGHFSLVTPLLSGFTGGQNVTLQSVATADIVTLPAAGGVSPTASPSSNPSPSPSASAGSSPSASPSASPSVMPCPTPLVNFTTNQQNKNKPVVFTSTSTPTSGPCAIVFWRWEYGDGTTDAGAVSTASHDYGVSGATFNVTLTVTYPDGTAYLTRAVTTR
jgi:Flp pilus assembly protein TadG